MAIQDFVNRLKRMMPEYSSAVADKRANEYLGGRGFDYRNQPSDVPYGMAPDEEQQMLEVLKGQIGSLMDSMNPNLQGEGASMLFATLANPKGISDSYNKYQNYRLNTPDSERGNKWNGLTLDSGFLRELDELMRSLVR